MTIDTKKLTSFSKVPQRQVFGSFQDALPYIEKVQELADETVPWLVYGLNVETNEIAAWPENCEVMVALMHTRQKATATAEASTSVKAIIVHPVPTLQALLDNEVGRVMIRNIVYKELNHRAVRNLRNSDNPAAIAVDMPDTIAKYAESGRGIVSALMQPFEDLYRTILDYFKNKSTLVRKTKLNKADLRRSFENSSYASHYFGALEDANLFERMLQIATHLANKRDLDPTIFTNWLNTRDDAEFEMGADDDEDFDFEDFEGIAAELAAPKTEEVKAETTDEVETEATPEVAEEVTTS